MKESCMPCDFSLILTASASDIRRSTRRKMRPPSDHAPSLALWYEMCSTQRGPGFEATQILILAMHSLSDPIKSFGRLFGSATISIVITELNPDGAFVILDNGFTE